MSKDDIPNPWDSIKKKNEDPVSSKSSPKKASDHIEDFLNHLHKTSRPGGKPPRKKNTFMIILIALVFVVIWLSTGFYRVQEGEVGIILRFGKVVRQTGPGLHYRMPTPIEEEIVINVAVYNRIDGGNKDDSSTRRDEHNLILTGDENIVHVNYTVLWKIKDIFEFLFTARYPQQTIHVVSESVIREILGQTTARLALTEGRETIGTKAQELMQKILDNYKMGVQIVSIQLQKVEAPSQVIAAFNDVQASLTDANRLENEAEAYKNDILPRARGEAEKIRQDAQGYAQQVVANAEGDAARFTSILEVYLQNPKVTARRMYIELASDVLKNPKTIMDPNTNTLPLFDLQKKVQQ